jgi:hypothetical protein
MTQTHQPLRDRLSHLSDTCNANFHARNSQQLVHTDPRA